MNQFKDFTENECIYCETQEEWNAIIGMNPSNKLTNKHFEYYKEIVYYPENYENTRAFSTLEYAQSQNYTIHQASEFLKPKFEHLEEIEVSQNKSFILDNNKGKFIGVDSQGKIVVELCKRYASYNYARKINHERTQAINQIKELMQKFNIKKEEI